MDSSDPGDTASCERDDDVRPALDRSGTRGPGGAVATRAKDVDQKL
jgi:hypothetical protein